MYHTNPTIDALMKRAYLYLEDRNWQSAKSYFDRCLDMDPENAKAYVRANKRMEAARKERDFREAAALFGVIPEYKDAAEKAQNCQYWHGLRV